MSQNNEMLPMIDCDVHNQLRSYEDLFPYLDGTWISQSKLRGGGLPNVAAAGDNRKDPGDIIQHLIEPYSMDYALLCCDSVLGVSAFGDADYAAAVCRAYNDLLLAEWLPKSPKFKGYLCVATQDPEQAAREIDRIAPHPDIVGVSIVAGSRMPYGQRFFHPIYEACQRNGVPLVIHPGAEGAGVFNPPTAAGYVSTRLEMMTCQPQTYMAHLVSLICEGVFEKYPDFKVVLSQGGISWLPPLLWRLDKNFKALRETTPWLKRMPSEYAHDHIFLTTHPIEEPDNPKHLDYIFEMFDAENMLLFSSNYPHSDFDDSMQMLKQLPVEKQQKIYSENARTLFKLA